MKRRPVLRWGLLAGLRLAVGPLGSLVPTAPPVPTDRAALRSPREPGNDRDSRRRRRPAWSLGRPCRTAHQRAARPSRRDSGCPRRSARSVGPGCPSRRRVSVHRGRQRELGAHPVPGDRVTPAVANGRRGRRQPPPGAPASPPGGGSSPACAAPSVPSRSLVPTAPPYRRTVLPYAPPVSQATIAILGVGVGLLGAWAGLAALLISGQRALHAEIRGVRADLHALSDRVARLEGAFPFIAAANASSAPIPSPATGSRPP